MTNEDDRHYITYHIPDASGGVIVRELFNENHDPETGQFVEGGGSSGGSGGAGGSSSKIDKNLHGFENSIRTEQRGEVLRIVDKDGNVILTKSNKGKSITTTESEDAAMRGNIVTHNHPSGAAPSQNDYFKASATDAQEMRVVGVLHDGQPVTYSITKPDTGWIKGKEYYKISDPIEKKFKDEMMANIGKEDYNKLEQDRSHRVWSELTKIGVVNYKRVVG